MYWKGAFERRQTGCASPGAVDTATGAHLWAERFDGGLSDIFDLQDQVTESVVGAIAPAVEKAEIERAKRKPDRKSRRLYRSICAVWPSFSFLRSAGE